MSDRKKFLPDTSSLVDDSGLLYKLFEGNDVQIHYKVLEELDSFKTNYKKGPEERGNARKSLNIIKDSIAGFVGDPLPVGNGGTITIVENENEKTYTHADPAMLDYLKEQYSKTNEVILISEDTGFVARAWARKYKAQSNRSKRKGKSLDEIFSLPDCVDLSPELRKKLREGQPVSIGNDELNQYNPNIQKLIHNQYLHLDREALALRYSNSGNVHNFNPLWVGDNTIIQGIYPKNKDQKYAMDACLDDKRKYVSLIGKAGTGKTLVALACGLHSVLETKKYEKLIVVRSTAPLGREIGFLPGSVEQKMDPYFGPIRDNMEVIFKRRRVIPGSKRKGSEEGEVDTMELEYYLNTGVIQFLPLTYMRGRSIPDAFIVFDEAQNLTSSIAKTILTRPNETSKIVFTGDPFQIDEPYLDTENNGLTYSTKRFLGQDIFSTVILKKGERSELAELAADLL